MPTTTTPEPTTTTPAPTTTTPAPTTTTPAPTTTTAAMTTAPPVFLQVGKEERKLQIGKPQGLTSAMLQAIARPTAAPVLPRAVSSPNAEEQGMSFVQMRDDVDNGGGTGDSDGDDGDDLDVCKCPCRELQRELATQQNALREGEELLTRGPAPTDFPGAIPGNKVDFPGAIPGMAPPPGADFTSDDSLGADRSVEDGDDDDANAANGAGAGAAGSTAAAPPAPMGDAPPPPLGFSGPPPGIFLQKWRGSHRSHSLDSLS